MVSSNTAESDPVLLPFLTASDREDAEASLVEIIRQQKDSTIKEIVRNKLRVSLSASDASHANQEALDLVNEIQTALLSQLRSLKSQSDVQPIEDFGRYVATTTFNACNQLLRRKYPKRFQLKNKLRYLLSHETDFGIWERDKAWLCGLTEWHGSPRLASATTRVQELKHQRKSVAVASERRALKDLLAHVFQILGSPVLLDELVSVVIEQLQIREDTTIEYETAATLPASEDATPLPLTQMESRAHVGQMWLEICELPLRHRCALLLNLRDRHGTDALELFHATRVATLKEIAEVLDFQLDHFVSVWKELPWDDATIANHLKLSRQQVINLRQSARKRLARRLRPAG